MARCAPLGEVRPIESYAGFNSVVAKGIPKRIRRDRTRQETTTWNASCSGCIEQSAGNRCSPPLARRGRTPPRLPEFKHIAHHRHGQRSRDPPIPARSRDRGCAASRERCTQWASAPSSLVSRGSSSCPPPWPPHQTKSSAHAALRPLESVRHSRAPYFLLLPSPYRD